MNILGVHRERTSETYSTHSFKPSVTKSSPYTETAITLEHPYTKQKLGRNIMDEEDQNMQKTLNMLTCHI